MIGDAVLNDAAVLKVWRALAGLATTPLPVPKELGGVVLRAPSHPIEEVAKKAGAPYEDTRLCLLALEAFGCVRLDASLNDVRLKLAPGAGDAFDDVLCAARGW